MLPEQIVKTAETIAAAGFSGVTSHISLRAGWRKLGFAEGIQLPQQDFKNSNKLKNPPQ